MIRVALKGLLGRKLRALLTALAVILGVAMIAGTYVLTDTIDAGFETIFTGSYKGASAVVTAKVAFINTEGPQTEAPSFAAGTLERVRALPDVAAAAGSVTSQGARLVGRDGKTIQVGGAPNLGFSVDAREGRFNPLSLVSGRWPAGPAEIAIDRATAARKHFTVGDTIGLAARGPVRRFRISGIAELASVASIGGATLAIFDLPTAQDVFHKRGQLDVIRIASRGGVDRKRLLREIGAVLPPTARVRDPDAQVKEDLKTVKFVGYVQKFLLVFGFIALFVGAFVIFNTLAITVAQRTREFATLRTIGATRGQVRRSVILEGLAIGSLGSFVGLGLGLGLAKGLDALFRVVGIDLPKSGTVFATRTVVVALTVGLLVTLAASLIPAIRATRVPPIAAVREGASLPRGRFAGLTPYAGLALIVLGSALLLDGVLSHGKTFSERLLLLGPGVLLAFVGVALFSSKIVRPLAWALGWPAAAASPFAGRMARENAQRNPGRTASTAAALMIGLTLVTFVAVLGKGLRQSFEDSVRKQFIADYALTSQNNFAPFDSAPERALAKLPLVLDVVGVRAGSGKAFGKVVNVTAVPRDVGRAITINWQEGDESTPARLGRDGIFVDSDYATKHRLGLGSSLRMETTTGKMLDLVVRGIFDPPNGGSPFGQITLSQRAFDAVYPQPEDLYAFVNVRGGASEAATHQLGRALKEFPAVKVADRDRFIANQERFITMLLNLLYVLLALSIVISLVGMVNTLVLSVYERTRELGMLRAIGTTRGQVGLITVFESIVTALIGTSIGLVLGLLLARLVVQPLQSDGIVFAVPWGTLAVFVLAAIVSGVLAALFPAWRASRLNVLEALQYE